MANIKPTMWKVIISLVGGLLVGLLNLYWGYKMYWTYQNTPRLAGYGYNFLDILIRNGYLEDIIWGFSLAVITIYLIYSILQKEKSKWNILWLFLLFIVTFIIVLVKSFDVCFLSYGANFFCDNTFNVFIMAYNIVLLIYIGIKYKIQTKNEILQ